MLINFSASLRKPIKSCKTKVRVPENTCGQAEEGGKDYVFFMG